MNIASSIELCNHSKKVRLAHKRRQKPETFFEHPMIIAKDRSRPSTGTETGSLSNLAVQVTFQNFRNESHMEITNNSYFIASTTFNVKFPQRLNSLSYLLNEKSMHEWIQYSKRVYKVLILVDISQTVTIKVSSITMDFMWNEWKKKVKELLEKIIPL